MTNHPELYFQGINTGTHMAYEINREKILANMQAEIPEHLDRINWTRDQIDTFQLNALRQLLSYAMKNSSWYRKKYQGITSDAFLKEDLSTLPCLTKKEVIHHWDEICCREDISKEIAEQHLQDYREGKTDDPFYKDKYYFAATGGSSGVRGLYVWDLDYFATVGCETFRYQHRDNITAKRTTPKKIAVITAPSLIHASTPLFSLVTSKQDKSFWLPADTPLETLCQKLNEIQPTDIIGFTSTIQELAKLAQLNKLKIKPTRVSTNSEPLDDEVRDIIYQAWAIKVNNMWGSVEMGLAAVEDDHYQGLLISEDLIILEPVDDNLNPVAFNQQAKRLIITNLFNYSLPLIRYVVDDAVIISPTEFSSYTHIKQIIGRTDDWFDYGNVRVHPMEFRHILGQYAEISEYQIEQTNVGALIYIIINKDIDIQKLQNDLVAALLKAELQSPVVNIEVTTQLPRHGETGKLKRFIPLK